MCSRASRTIEELKAPQSPRSAVQTTRRWAWSLPVPIINGDPSSRPCNAMARLASTASMREAYGRAASAALCARLSFAAATICMALVIFCVAFTLEMRLRSSFNEGIGRSGYAKALAKLSTAALSLSPVSLEISF